MLFAADVADARRSGRAALYGSWDLTSARQSFKREVTSELIAALSSTG